MTTPSARLPSRIQVVLARVAAFYRRYFPTDEQKVEFQRLLQLCKALERGQELEVQQKDYPRTDIWVVAQDLRRDCGKRLMVYCYWDEAGVVRFHCC